LFGPHLLFGKVALALLHGLSGEWLPDWIEAASGIGKARPSHSAERDTGFSRRGLMQFLTKCKLTAYGVALTLSVGSTAGTAAELRLDPANASGTGVVLEGIIETGDFERFKNIVVNSGHVREIYLASPGGNLAEAVKIGLLVRHLNLSTVVPSKQLTHNDRTVALARHGLKDNKDYTCASACFFIFVAGIYRSTDDHGAAILGLHAPTLLASAAAKLAPEQANLAIDRTRKVIADYFGVMGVPMKYTEEINSVPKTRMRWIRNDEFQSDFAGFIAEVRGLAKTKCGNRPDAVSPSTQRHNDQSSPQAQCESELRDELAARAFKDAVKAQSGDDRQFIFKSGPQSPPN
jgi:hypothetical protein